MKYAWYPGCSAEGNSLAYDETSRMIAEALGIEFQEINDWNCCGATEYFSVNQLPAYALVARNLALINAEETPQVIAPCSACYINLKKTDEKMGKYKQLNVEVNEALAAGDLSYEPGSVKSRHFLDVVCNDVGYEAINEKMSQSLAGLTLIPYYGCYMGRPEDNFDHPERPQTMDTLLKTLGANVPDYALKTTCCGGHMTQLSAEASLRILQHLLEGADQLKADAMVVGCPMCQLNLDAYQADVNRAFKTNYKIPIIYFSQVMGLAFGMDPKTLMFERGIVSSKPMLEKWNTAEPASKKRTRRKKRDKNALPMPKPLEVEV